MFFSTLKSNLFLKDKTILVNLIVSLSLFLASLLLLYFQMRPTTEPIALRYTIYLGIDYIGPWFQVFIFPLFGLIAVIINFTLSYLIFLKAKILAHFFALAASLIQIIFLIMSILIILLNK